MERLASGFRNGKKPRASESQLLPKLVERDRCILSGELAQETQEFGIVAKQLDLDLEVVQMHKSERGPIGLPQYDDSVLRQVDDLIKRRMVVY